MKEREKILKKQDHIRLTEKMERTLPESARNSAVYAVLSCIRETR